MSSVFRAEFAECLKDRSMAPNEHFASLTYILKKHGHCYTVPRVEPKCFLTHVKNRGGLLLSPHNSHHNAALIKAAGADLSQLSNAWAVEIAPSGANRQKVLEKNKEVIRRANGLLAEVTGQERFASLGCGHTVAFCKHARAGGRTTEKSLMASDSDQIDLHKLCSNKVFAEMINEGWSWNIVEAWVDEEFPQFAEVAERALNTRNHIHNVIGEIEACTTLSQTMNDPGMIAVENWKKLTVENLVSLCVPCASYGMTLLEYIIQYGNGPDAPMIRFVDAVAKQFAANIPMGETFRKALLDASFVDKTRKYVFLRTALMLTNLTGTKIEDETARTVTKTHISNIASKNKMADALESETILDDAWQLVKTLSSTEAALKPLGQLFVRVGLKMCGVEMKAGREKKIYSFLDIKKMLIKDLGRLLGKDVLFPKRFEESQQPDAPEEKKVEPSVAANVCATVENHFDPKWILGTSGFKVGTKVIEKGVEQTADRPGIFVVFDIKETVVLQEVCSYSGAPARAVVTVENFLKTWQKKSSEAPIKMTDPSTEVPIAYKLTSKKNMVFSTLLDVYEKHQKHLSDLVYYRNPDQVRTKGLKIKSGALTLVPFVPINNVVIDAKHQKAIEVCEWEGHKFSIAAPPKPSNKADAWDENAVVNAFFWVHETSHKKLVNMKLSSLQAQGLDIPVFKNIVDIEPFTRWCTYVKPKAAVTPLQHVVEQDDHDDDDQNDDEPDEPAAKGKAKSPAPKKKTKSVASKAQGEKEPAAKKRKTG